MLEWCARIVKKGKPVSMIVAITSYQWPEWLTWFGQFTSYGVLFGAAVVSAMMGTPIYIIVARRLGWVDHPFGRKCHERATATMGGLVVFTVVFAGTIVAMNLQNLVGEKLRANRGDVYGLLACTFCMILLGILDDRFAIRPKVKLLVQTVVAIGAVFLGFRIEAITLPWFDSVLLPDVVGVLLSLLWIVGITNAINLTDGLDGLAAGVCFLAAAVNAVVAVWLGNHYMAVMMVLLAGSLLGFLRWNFYPARVFLGDTGSLALGMFLALASLHSAQKSHTVVLILFPLFALGYPIFDTLLAVARRMVRGQPLFVSDRDHIHHRLLARNQSPSRAAIQIYVASLLVSLVCIAAITANYRILGVGVAGAVLMALFSARILGYLEWGGWQARWSGREETKLLHAAAHLARLRIEQARNVEECVWALSVIAPEIGCRAIVLSCRGEETQWVAPYTLMNDDAEEAGAEVKAKVKAEADVEVEAGTEALEMVLDEGTAVRFTLDQKERPDEDRRHLIEDLCRDVGERLLVLQEGESRE